jgi:exopolysaccharide biosynthesis polyprenyl glycosylphosphotransferase
LKRPLYKYLLAIMDFVVLLGSFLAAITAREGLQKSYFLSTFPFIEQEILFFAIFSLFILLIFQYENLYKINLFLTVAEQITRIVYAICVSVIGFAVAAFFLKKVFIIPESRLVIFYYFIFAVLFLSFSRVVLFRGIFILVTKKKLYSEPTLIIGSGNTAKMIATNISIDRRYALSLIGFVDNDLKAGMKFFQDKKILGSIKNIKQLVKQYSIKEIIICTENTTHDQLLRTYDICRGTRSRVKIASPLFGIISEKLFTEKYGDVAVIDAAQNEENLTVRLIKRVFDLTVALAGFIVLLPVLFIIAIAIRIDTPGPALYSQVRVGKDGRKFKFYKFRSMIMGSDTDGVRTEKAIEFIKNNKKGKKSKSTKIVDNSKITRVGRFIRKTSLDELPQLFNVIKGDMSLVGPRPCLPYEWINYDEWHKRRLSTTPGCTGVWQISGRSEVTFDDMVILDLYYIQNRSLLFDLEILFKTIPVMVFGKGGI